MATATPYNSYKLKLFDSSTKINFTGDTIKVSLHTSSYTPSIDNHDFWDDVSASEVVGTGYTTGGATLGTKTATQDNTNDWAAFDCADVTWSTSTITARYAIVYKSTGTPSTSPLIGYIDFGSNKISEGDNFTLTIDSVGIVKIA
jgi:hypothetical protein